MFGKERIEVLVADREFIGDYWLSYLKKEQIPYSIRIKENGQYISNSRGQMVKICDLLTPLQRGTRVTLGVRKIGRDKVPYHVSAARNKEGSLIVLIHSEHLSDTIEIYRKRWEIETMFKAFKSNGFFLEATHLTDPERLNTLLSVMAIAFCCAIQTGAITALSDPVPLKAHGRKAQSIFRYGLNILQNLFANTRLKITKLRNLIRKIFNKFNEL